MASAAEINRRAEIVAEAGTIGARRSRRLLNRGPRNPLVFCPINLTWQFTPSPGVKRHARACGLRATAPRGRGRLAVPGASLGQSDEPD